MSIEVCLEKLVKVGRITRRQANAALKLNKQMQGELTADMGPASADAAGALEAARQMLQAAKEKQAAAAKQALTFADVQARMANHPAGKTAGLHAVLARDIHEAGSKTGNAINIDSHSEAITKRLLGMLNGSLEPYASRLAGLKQDTESVWNLVYELFGNDTGDQAAKAAAVGWKKTTDYIVERIQRTGRPLSQLEDWRVPQFWDMGRVRKFKEAEFVKDLLTEYQAGNLRVLDKEAYADAKPENVPDIIAGAFKNITLGRAQGAVSGLSNEVRVFRFQNADALRRLMSKYGMGNGGLYGTLMGHIGAAGREIGTLELLGPKPETNFRKLLEEARIDDAARNDTIRKKIARTVTLNSPAAVQRTFDSITGKLGVVESETIAGIFGGLRNIQTSARLGSATVAAVPGDSVLAALTSNFNGIPAGAVLARAMQDLTIRGKESEELAKQLNVTAASIIDHALGSKRFADEVVGSGFTGRVADTAMRITGINIWTENLKRAFSMEMAGLIARQAEHALDKVDPAFGRFLQRYGFSSADWDKLRATAPIEAQGARFFDFNGVEDQALADRLMSAVIDERHFAVIEPDARIRATMAGGAQRGTLWGEIIRSASQFKSFPMALMMTHLTRTAMQDGAWGKAMSGVKLLTLLTFAGAAVSQAQSLISGKDPANMQTPQFWLSAFIRGGGAGMFGDIAYSSTTRGGDDTIGYFAGPVIGTTIGQTADLIHALAQNKNGISGKMLADYVKAWTPGSSTWYAKLALDRLFFDHLQMAVDPHYREAFRRFERRIKKDYGQELWWRPGEMEPRRLPQYR